MNHSDFVTWVEKDVRSKFGLQDRLDGKRSGGNREIFGRFDYAGRTWKVHGDTRVEKIRIAYEAITNRVLSEPFEIVSRANRLSLNLHHTLRLRNKPKHLYIYEI